MINDDLSVEEWRKEINRDIDSYLWPYSWRIRRVGWAIIRFYKRTVIFLEKL